MLSVFSKSYGTNILGNIFIGRNVIVAENFDIAEKTRNIVNIIYVYTNSSSTTIKKLIAKAMSEN